MKKQWSGEYAGDVVYIRGIPIGRQEVYFHQQRLGAQLFDESMFNDRHKQQACATIIYELDRTYRRYIEKYGEPTENSEPIRLDIGDPSWVYIPVPLFNPSFESTGILSIKTKEKPVGLIAWFRYKKQYKPIKN